MKKYVAARIIGCVILIVSIICVVIIGEYRSSKVNIEQENTDDFSEAMHLYREKVEPCMLDDNVKTIIHIEDADGIAEMSYAISGINSLVSWYDVEKGKKSDFIEIWNNMEKYYVRTVTDGESHTFVIDITDDTRSSLNEVISSIYLSVVAQMGVAHSGRIISFEEVNDGVYDALSKIENAEYKLQFRVENDVLSRIQIFNESYPDTDAFINFEKYTVNKQAVYEKYAVDHCDVTYVVDMFGQRME